MIKTFTIIVLAASLLFVVWASTSRAKALHAEISGLHGRILSEQSKAEHAYQQGYLNAQVDALDLCKL